MNSVSERSVLAVRIAKFGLLLLFSVRKPKEEFCAFLATRRSGLASRKMAKNGKFGTLRNGRTEKFCLFVCLFFLVGEHETFNTTYQLRDRYFEVFRKCDLDAFPQVLHRNIASFNSHYFPAGCELIL